MRTEDKWLRKQADKVRKVDWIDPALYSKYGVKRGLRNDNGTGVLVGLTTIGNVHGYVAVVVIIPGIEEIVLPGVLVEVLAQYEVDVGQVHLVVPCVGYGYAQGMIVLETLHTVAPGVALAEGGSHCCRF